MPFDANGAIFWKGRYHLCYIFQRFQDSDPTDVQCWGHSSSTDLIHWTQHPTALDITPDDPDRGIDSGSAFVTREGRPAIIYHGARLGNCIALADDDDLIHWTKLPSNPIVPHPLEGDSNFGVYSSWDPCAWREGDTYYAVFGGLPHTGTPATLFKSENLTDWHYQHRMIDADFDAKHLAANDDLSCPDFFPLGDKHVLMGISHIRGARYYIGTWKDEVFTPESHGWMNWAGGKFFAPESLVDDKGRRIMWAWVLDPRPSPDWKMKGWPGAMSLPRVLTLGEDGILNIAPPVEMESLRQDRESRQDVALPRNKTIVINGVEGDTMELDVVIDPGDATDIGIAVRRSPGEEEQTVIVYNKNEQTLSIDFSRSVENSDNKATWFICMPKDAQAPHGMVTRQTAPFALKPGEPLHLRVFLDRSILEVFANERQCITQRFVPNRLDSLGVALRAGGGDASVTTLDAWQLQP